MEKSKDSVAIILLFIISFAFYAGSLSHMPTDGDSCELAANAILGKVLHPPGYALYGSLLRLCQHFPIGTEAFKCGLLSVLSGAFAVCLFFILARLLNFGLVESFGSALLLSASSQLWIQATRIEVYALELALFLATICAYVHWDKKVSSYKRATLFTTLFTVAFFHRLNAFVIAPVVLLHFYLRHLKEAKNLDWSSLLKHCFIGFIIGLLPLISFCFVSFDNVVIYGPEQPTLCKVIFGGGGYFQYLFKFQNMGLIGRTSHVVTLLSLQAQFIGLAMACLGWILIVHQGETRNHKFLLFCGLAHLFFIWSYGVDDVETMMLPTWSMLALGWVGLFTSWRNRRETLVYANQWQKAVAYLILFLMLIWWNGPLHKNANSTALYEVIKAFHERLDHKCHIFTHKTEEGKMFTLYYVNEITGPKKELKLHSFSFEGMSDNIDVARLAIGDFLNKGQAVYVSLTFPIVKNNFETKTLGPYSEIIKVKPKPKRVKTKSSPQ